MTMILDLPEDVIIIILCTNNMSVQDCVNISSTCKHFRQMIENLKKILWMRKFYQRWSRLQELCKKEMRKGSVDFKKLLETRINCGKELRHVLAQMNEKNFYKYDLYESFACAICIQMALHISTANVSVDEEDLNFLLNQTTYPMNYYFLMDELKNLFERSQSGHTDELTNIYYGKKLLPYLKHYHLRNVWQEFINRPIQQQLMEKVVIFVTQWCSVEEDIFYSHVVTELDNIAQEVIKHLRNKHPIHPIFSVSNKQFSFWKYNNTDESQWNNKDGKQILNILCKVLSKLNFEYSAYFQNTTFIREYIRMNYIAERNREYIVLLAILFQSVARRLGICCDILFSPQCSPNQYFLSWKPKYNNTNADDEQYFYIDFFCDNTFWNINNYPKFHPSIREARCSIENACKVNSVELALRLVQYIYITEENDLYTRSLELEHLITPDDTDVIEKLSYCYEEQNRSISTLITALRKINDSNTYEEASHVEQILNRLLQNEKEMICKCKKHRGPKKREEGMKFAVGMIVRINNQSVHLIGVISGWTTDYYLFKRSNLNITCSSQWLYKVLCEDGKIYDVFQDELVIKKPPKPINNSLVGRFFCEFKDTYYIPNEMLAKKYPDDILYLQSL